MFDPLAIMMTLALAVFAWVRRAKVLEFRWQPDRSALFAIGASLAIFALSFVLTVPSLADTTKSAILHFGIYTGLGVWLPLLWNFSVEKAGFAGLGIRRAYLGRSIIVNLLLGAFLASIMVTQADWTAIDMSVFWAALFVLLTGNFFELIFYFGFVHLRLTRAFGPVVGVFGTAFLYVLWHVGTELTLVENIWGTALTLFAVGVLYQAVFAWTYNLAIIFPFFVAGGVMLDFAVKIEALDSVAPFVGWSVVTWLLFAAGFGAVWVHTRRHRSSVGAVTEASHG